jgi:tRNA(Ile)-lysidine synthase
LLPLLDDIAGRDTAAILARTAAVLREDADLLARVAGDVDPTDARALAAADPAVARRALRAWLTDDGYPPDRAAVDRVFAVVLGDRKACEVSGGRRVERSGGRLSIVLPAEIASPDGDDDVL